MRVKSVQFLAPLAGHVSICKIHYIPTEDGEDGTYSMDKLEAPFWVYWDDDSKMKGILFVSLSDVKDDAYLLRNMDNQKAAEWAKMKLESLPEEERIKHKNDRWTYNISIEILKLWQKEKK